MAFLYVPCMMNGMKSGCYNRRESDGDIKGVDDTESLGTTVPDTPMSDIGSDFAEGSFVGGCRDRFESRHRASSLSVADEWSSCKRLTVARSPWPTLAMPVLPALPLTDNYDFADDDYDPTSPENIAEATTAEVAEAQSQVLRFQIGRLRASITARGPEERGSKVLYRYEKVLQELEAEYAECMDNISFDSHIAEEDDDDKRCEQNSVVDDECADGASHAEYYACPTEEDSDLDTSVEDITSAEIADI